MLLKIADAVERSMKVKIMIKRGILSLLRKLQIKIFWN